MGSATRVFGWSLLIALLVGVLWPERPELPDFVATSDGPLQAASYGAPAPPPRDLPPGGCPTPTCLQVSPLPGLLR